MGAGWIKSAVIRVLGALLFVAGYMLMTSSGAWFPWANFAGAVLFAALVPFCQFVKLP